MADENAQSMVAIGFVGGRPSIMGLLLGLVAAVAAVAHAASDSFAASLGPRLFFFAVLPAALAFAVYLLRVLGAIRTVAASKEGVFLNGRSRERVSALGAAGGRLHVTTDQGEASLWLAGRGSSSMRASSWARRASALLPRAATPTPLVPRAISSPTPSENASLAGSWFGWAIGALLALLWAVVLGTRAALDLVGSLFEMSLARDIYALNSSDPPTPFLVATLAIVGGVALVLVSGALWSGLPVVQGRLSSSRRILIAGIETHSPGRRRPRTSSWRYALAAAIILVGVLLIAGGLGAATLLLFDIGPAPYLLLSCLFLARLVRVIGGLRAIEISGRGVRVRLDGRWQQARLCGFDDGRIMLGDEQPMLWLAFARCGRQADGFGDARRLAQLIQESIEAGGVGAARPMAKAHE